MRILFCDNSLFSLINFRGSILQHFKQKGHEIVVLAPDLKHEESKIEIPDFIEYIPIEFNRTTYNPFLDFSYSLRLLYYYHKIKPDIVFHYTIKPNIYGSLIAHLLGIPSISMVAGLGYAVVAKGLKGVLTRKFYSFGLSFSKKVFVLNATNQHEIISTNLAKPDQLVLLKYGEGLDIRKYPECKTIIKDKTIFLMVGRVLYDKGYKEFVEASQIIKSQFPDVEFKLLGPIDNLYPNSVSLNTVKNDEKLGFIQYIGFTSTPIEVMAQPNVVMVLPSYHEGMSRSVMEACTLGRPVICSDIPGCREMVKHLKNGYLVPVRDSKALAKAMRAYLLLSDTEKINMGHESRLIAEENFSVSHVIFEYERVVEEVLHKKGLN